MLSEQVLEELARAAPLQQALVTTAWPSLGVESRLQVIHAIQRAYPHTTPDWLMLLCTDDPAPIVRYWAARHYSFAAGVDRVFDGPLAEFSRPAPEHEKALRAKTASDECDLVRACTEEDPWASVSDQVRWVFARNHGTAHYITGLSKAFEAGMSDEVMSQCLRELLEKPAVQEELRFKGMYAEGDTAHYEGQIVKDGWALARKAGPRTQWLLAAFLPTNRGLARISAAELATMPAEVLQSLAWRSDKTPEITAALEIVLNKAQDYDPKVIESISRALEHTVEGDAKADRAKSALDRGQQTLDQVLNLQRQLAAVAEQLHTMSQSLQARKGWFS
jgi:hypothetical protein